MNDLHDAEYDSRFTTPRNQWLAWYFSWTDNTPENEIHVAKDGFDAGANYQLKKDQKIIDTLRAEIAQLKVRA